MGFRARSLLGSAMQVVCAAVFVGQPEARDCPLTELRAVLNSRPARLGTGRMAAVEGNKLFK
jgi:hypothetical protein